MVLMHFIFLILLEAQAVVCFPHPATLIRFSQNFSHLSSLKFRKSSGKVDHVALVLLIYL